MSKTSPTQILLDTDILSRATSRLLEDLGLPASAKQRALNTLAVEICDNPKRNWGYLTNYADGILEAARLAPPSTQANATPAPPACELDISYLTPQGDIRIQVHKMNPALFVVSLPGHVGVQYLSFSIVLADVFSLTRDDTRVHLLDLWRRLPEGLQEKMKPYALKQYAIFKASSRLAKTAAEQIAALPETISFDVEFADKPAPVVDLIVADNPRHEAVLERVLDYYLLHFLEHAWESDDQIEYTDLGYVYDDIAAHMPEPYLREIKALNRKLLTDSGHAPLIERRHAQADQAFEDHDFGAYVVEDKSGWEYVNDGRVMSRPVFFEDPTDPERDSLKGCFEIVFKKNSDKIIEVSATCNDVEI